MPEQVSFKTDDGVTIVGDFVAAPGADRAVLLLHMMPATKESWRPFATKLAERGFASLAIDLRGHGDSTVAKSGPLDYKLFSDFEQQDKFRDVEAALGWFAGRGFPASRLALIGASIGANLAIQAAARHPEIPAAVALSPGLDYRGVTTADQVARLGSDQALLLAASADDEYSFLTDRRLADLRPDAVLKELRAAGHGTNMFEKEPALMDQIIDWLTLKIK